MTNDNRWYSVLDDIDTHLEQQERALDAGRPDLVVAFALPPGRGPLPPNRQRPLSLISGQAGPNQRGVLPPCPDHSALTGLERRTTPCPVGDESS